MAAGGVPSSSSGATSSGGEEPLHLLVIILDASDSFTRSCSLEDPTQQVGVYNHREEKWIFLSTFVIVATAVSLSVSGCRDDLFELLSADEPREQCGRMLMSSSWKVCVC